jgi:hypothetical protein
MKKKRKYELKEDCEVEKNYAEKNNKISKYV